MHKTKLNNHLPMSESRLCVSLQNVMKLDSILQYTWIFSFLSKDCPVSKVLADCPLPRVQKALDIGRY